MCDVEILLGRPQGASSARRQTDLVEWRRYASDNDGGLVVALRAAITYGVFPVTFVAAMLLAVGAIDRGYSHPGILAAITAATALIVAGCERINPQYAEWNVSRGDVGTDVLHGLVSQIALPRVLEVALQALLLTAAAELSHWLGSSLWPSTWPILLQLPLAMLVSQFGEYWLHRWMHERPLLWRLHATHHSPARLYWLNAGRFHPLDTAGSFAVAMTPLVLLGVSTEVMLLVTVWIVVHGLFQHCNVRLRLGPLNYIFSMAELHRWHHSLKLEEANTNYGNNTIFWDIVFGTMFYPSGREAAAEVGLSGLPRFPQRYLGQLLSPLRWSQIEEADEG